jgi:ribosomal protein L35
LLRRKAMQSHNLEKKSAKRKRAFTRDQPVAPSDAKNVSKLFPGQVK